MDILEQVWNSVLYEGIRIDPTTTPLLVINSAFLDIEFKLNQLKMAFETFNFPRLYLTISNVTGILAEGKSSGVILDSGYLGTTCLRIFEGYPETQEMKINLFGGSFMGKF